MPGYDILGELGRGGMGVVYKARQKSLKRIVALKMIRDSSLARPEDLARFQIEAEALAALKHPNIVQIYEIGDFDGMPYFSLEYVEGGSLVDKLKGKPLPFREAAELVETLARAVASAHQSGVVHRDLKPGNVLLDTHGTQATGFGTVKITDFGLAKHVGPHEGLSQQTHSGAILGTPSYMAPEQADPRFGTVGKPADIYALGAILYELLTGRPPFWGESVIDTLVMACTEEPVPPSQLRAKLPADLETICLKCLRKQQTARYTSAEALAEDLRRYLDGEPILARPIHGFELVWRWVRNNPVPTSLLVAVTLGSAFGLWYLSHLSTQLFRSSALESVAQQSAMMEDVAAYYSSHVVERIKGSDVAAAHNYTKLKDKHAVPIPATLTIELGQLISSHNEKGMQVRLYSDQPFLGRTDGGPKDDFERNALHKLRENPKEPVYSFEEYRGQPVLRYATARLMGQSCVDCHNTHPESPRKDWKVGELLGTLEIIRPLAGDVERTREGLRGTFILVGVIAVGLLGVCSLVLVMTDQRRSYRRKEPAKV